MNEVDGKRKKAKRMHMSHEGREQFVWNGYSEKDGRNRRKQICG
jgi:hypothetical protein